MEKKPNFEFEFDFAKDLKKYNLGEYDSFCSYLSSQNIDIAKLDRFDGSVEKLHQEFWTKNNKDKPYVDLLDRITTDYSHPNENNTQTEQTKEDKPTLTDFKPLAEEKETVAATAKQDPMQEYRRNLMEKMFPEERSTDPKSDTFTSPFQAVVADAFAKSKAQALGNMSSIRANANGNPNHIKPKIT